MPKQKPSAQIRIADGAGGMRPVTDLRFEDGDWPIDLVVAAEDAATLMAHLTAELEERRWRSSGLSQIDATENSGTLSVHAASGPNPPTLHIVWDKPRDAELRLKARPGGNPMLSLDVARELIDAVIERVRQRISTRAHRWDLLSYEGLPWRGEPSGRIKLAG